MKAAGFHAPRLVTQGGTHSVVDRVSRAGVVAAKCMRWALEGTSPLRHMPWFPLAQLRLAPERAACQAPAHSRWRSPGTVPAARAERGRERTALRRTSEQHRAVTTQNDPGCQGGQLAETWLRPPGKVDNHGLSKHSVLERAACKRAVPGVGGTWEQPGRGPVSALGPAVGYWPVVGSGDPLHSL